MKKLISLLLIVAFNLSLFCNDEYGNSYTKVFLAKNKLQAKYVVWRFNLADLAQFIEKDGNCYFIEFLYENDDKEMLTKNVPVIPKRMQKQIEEIYFLKINNNETLDLGGGLKLKF